MATEPPRCTAGQLAGGHLGAVVGHIGAGLPSLDGAILFLETQRAIGLG